MRHEALQVLVREHLVRDASFFDGSPQVHTDPVADRIRGMLLGAAIGDALGNTTEGINPGERRERFGEIRDYLPNRYAAGRAVGLPSDDTQLSFRTVEQLLADGEFRGEPLLARFAAEQVFGMGTNTRHALEHFRTHGFDWSTVGTVGGAGNGAMMRIAPVLLPHLQHPTARLWSDTALATVITHRDAAAVAVSVAWVALLWDLIGMKHAPAPEWWAERFIDVVRQVEGPGHSYRPRGGAWSEFDGSLTEWLERCQSQFSLQRSAIDGGRLWYSGAYLLETVPSVLHILTLWGDDPEEAMARAVNDTRDNDTIASIVGAALGGLHGTAGFSERWMTGLLGRTRDRDDGWVHELVDRAVVRFVRAPGGVLDD